jgi:hypothetical protein
MNILFFTHPFPNYVPDFLLHGLRKLFGNSVVDYPRKDCIYEGILEGALQHGPHRFSLFDPDNGEIDREDIRKKIHAGHFQYIICDVRAIDVLKRQVLQWPSRLVLIDGEDIPVRIPPGPYVVCCRETDGSGFSIPLPMALPEELFRWISHFDGRQKTYSVGFLGVASHGERNAIVEALAARYPDALLNVTTIPSSDNPTPVGRVGRDDYYCKLQRCKIVLSLRGLGYDTLRFWEDAACNAVHVCQKMPLYIPNDFVHGEHIFRFSSIPQLVRVIDNILEGRMNTDATIQRAHHHLLSYHLTTKRAEYLLQRLKTIFAN